MDEPTIVIQQPPEIVEVPTAPTVSETLGAAAVVVEMANNLAEQNTPVDRSHEIIAILSEIRDDMRALRATPPAPVIVEIEPEVIEEVPEPAPEIIVAAGDIKKEEISEAIPPTAPPTKRKRNWL